jgi:subtilase family serine protease
MIRLVQRLAAIVAAALLLSVVAAAPAGADQPSWSHHDQRVCSEPGANQAECTSIVRSFYRNGRPFHARTEAELAAAADTADQVSYFHGTDLRTAYGITGQGDPSKVVAIVDAYDDPDAFTNLTRFRTDQNLPAMPSCTLTQLGGLDSSASNPCFAKVNQTGGTSLPSADSGWANEIDLDLQAVSAICPRCSILLLEASSTSLGNLGTAVTTASNTPHVLAISNSYGARELFSSSYSAWNNAAAKGIAVTASTGDGGYGVIFPSSSTYVIGVGGTTLAVDGAGVRSSETAWAGAGSGCSRWNAAPAWQTIPGDPCGNYKAVADLSADADPSSGLAVYTTYSNSTGYWIFGGTSLSSPLIAALYAMQGGYGGSTQAGQYAWAAGTPYYDVTSGSNGSCKPSVLCTAGTGWDGPTGLGSISVAPSAPPVLTTITVSPDGNSVQTGDALQFAATGYDQYGQPMSPQPTFTWSVDGGGTVSATGLFTATTAGGPFTVTATSGSVSGTAQVTVTEAPSGSFSLSVTPSSRTITRGDSTTYTVTINPTPGFTGSVTLSVSGAPSKATVTFSPNPADGGSSILTIDTGRGTSRQTYDLTITGVSGSQTDSKTVSLTVLR